MFNVFNMGIGFVLAVKEEYLTDVIGTLESHGEKAYLIGRVKKAKASHLAVRHFHEKSLRYLHQETVQTSKPSSRV